jgi:hypothetical protein
MAVSMVSRLSAARDASGRTLQVAAIRKTSIKMFLNDRLADFICFSHIYWSQTAMCARTKGKKLHFRLPKRKVTMHSADLKENKDKLLELKTQA